MTTLESECIRDDGNDFRGASDERTGTFDALGHRFAVTCTDPRIIALVEEAFDDLAVGGPPISRYHFRRHADCVHISWMGATVGIVTDRAGALSVLRAHVQQSAIAAADADLVLRAGCVAFGERALVLSGDNGCGVSTLLAALVSEGGTYLSDDAIPVELRSGRVRPFPQPVLLDDRSLDLLPEVAALRAGANSTTGRRLVVMGCAPTAPGRSSWDVAVVLFPEYDDSGVTLLRPVDPDDAVVRLAEHAYNFPGREAEAIEAIDWLVRDAATFAVVGSDPRSGARAVIDALTGAS